jgi:GT2 family glycosyltransferase
VVLDIEQCSDVATARNSLAKRLVEPYLLFFDADMVFSSRQIEALYMALLEKPERGAVAAHACRWDGKQTPVCNWREDGEWLKLDQTRARALEYTLKGSVERVDMFGTGVVLISKKVFDALEYPWFVFDYENNYGEDTCFCLAMIEAGFEPSVHFGVPVGHVGPTLWMPDGVGDAQKEILCAL